MPTTIVLLSWISFELGGIANTDFPDGLTKSNIEWLMFGLCRFSNWANIC